METQLSDRLSALEHENALLRSRLRDCEQSHAILAAQVAAYQQEQPTQAKREQVDQLVATESVSSPKHRLLEATAIAINTLLTTSHFDNAVNATLQIIGEALDTDRVAVIENFDVPSEQFPHWRILYEWDSLDTISQLTHLDVSQGTYKGIEEWYERLSQGQSIRYLLEEMPEPFRTGQAKLGVKVLHVVPIFIKSCFWGVVGFDDCREVKQRSAAELSVLRIAADCIGSAILRERTQQALLEAEQKQVAELAQANAELQQRDHQVKQSYRLLSTVAEVTKNLLENPHVDEAIAQALRQIGEAADISRVILMLERRGDRNGQLQHQVIYEWVAPDTSKQMENPQTALMDNDDYGFLIDELHAGRSIWRVLEEFPEPARTQQSSIDVKSTGAVPIFIEGKYFGCVGFDDCITHRQWTPHEIDVLTSSAGAIGAALHRKQLIDRLVEARIQAEHKRAVELAKANDALKQTVDVLATETDLNHFLGHVLRVIADQLDAPLTEYWNHPEPNDVAYVHLTYWQGKILKPEEQPGHVGLFGYPVPPEMVHQESLHHRRDHFIIEDMATSAVHTRVAKEYGLDAAAWYGAHGVNQLLNVPLILGDRTIGALIVFLPVDRQFTQQQIELANALAQQVTLAIQLTRLAEEAKQTAILNERNHMASEIHDTLAQSFTGILLQTEAIQHEDSSKLNCPALQRIQQLAEDGLAEARRSVRSLRPRELDNSNLFTALPQLVDRISTKANFPVELTLTGDPYPLPSDTAGNLLRIAQEAIHNALKHAKPTAIRVDLLYEPETVMLSIEDDGQGFDLQQQIFPVGFGIIGMQERTDRIGGQFSLSSSIDRGTTITVIVETSGGTPHNFPHSPAYS